MLHSKYKEKICNLAKNLDKVAIARIKKSLRLENCKSKVFSCNTILIDTKNNSSILYLL